MLSMWDSTVAGTASSAFVKPVDIFVFIPVHAKLSLFLFSQLFFFFPMHQLT